MGNTFTALRRTVEPASEPVTTALMKDHLRVTHSDDDTYIDSLIAAARNSVEEILSRSLISQTWAASFDSIGDNDRVRLPRPILISVSSVNYIDGDGNSQAVSSGDYITNTTSEPGQIYFTTVPDYDSEYDNPLTVTFVSGYGASASDIPDPIIHAIKLLVGHWYDMREAVVSPQGNNPSEIPFGVQSLLAPYRFKYS